MNFRFTPEQERLRQEVREFLSQEAPKESLRSRDDVWANPDAYDPEFSRKAGKKGWIGMTWPRERGGGGRSYIDRLVMTEEMLRHGAPVAGHWSNDRQMGPAVLAYGSEEQKKEFIPKFLAGEITLCIGMSEPEAGSDLASLRTRAVEDGDDFVISGQKVWTGFAHQADYIYMVVRTDPDAPRHRGISEFLVDMKLPGITVRPLYDQSGSHELNEVFFDEVRVPRTALVGGKNRGWYQIAAHIDYERAGLERCMSNRPLFEDFVDYAHQQALFGDPIVRHRVSELEVEFEVALLLNYMVAWVLSEDRVPNYEAAMAKVFGGEYQQHVADTITDVMGMYGQLMPDSAWAPLAGRAARNYLFSAGYSLMGGTSEVLRNVIALRGLRLPRE